MINPELLDNILLEWSYRLKDGIPDVNDPEKVKVLNQVLAENKLPLYEEKKDKISGKQAEAITVMLWNAHHGNFKTLSDFINDKSSSEFRVLYANIIKLIESLNGKNAAESLFKNFKIAMGAAPKNTSQIYAGRHDTVTTTWKEITGKPADEPKTDVLASKFHVSVKKGPAQLMSGVKEESLATFFVASEKTKLNKRVYAELEKHINEMKSAFKTDDPKLDKSKLAKTAIKDLSSTLNKKAKKLQVAGDALHKELNKLLDDIFKDNAKFKEAFVYESMTGEEKFGPGQAPTANYLVCYDNEVKRVKVEKITSETANKTAKAAKIKATFKSGSYDLKGKKAGYSLYSVIRTGIPDLVKTADKIHEQLENDILTEDVLTFIKEKFSALIQKLKDLYSWIKRFLVELKEAIEKGFHYVLQLIGIEPEIETNLDNINVFETL